METVTKPAGCMGNISEEKSVVKYLEEHEHGVVIQKI